jgi:hypothetical protein
VYAGAKNLIDEMQIITEKDKHSNL